MAEISPLSAYVLVCGNSQLFSLISCLHSIAPLFIISLYSFSFTGLCTWCHWTHHTSNLLTFFLVLVNFRSVPEKYCIFTFCFPDFFSPVFYLFHLYPNSVDFQNVRLLSTSCTPIWRDHLPFLVVLSSPCPLQCCACWMFVPGMWLCYFAF